MSREGVERTMNAVATLALGSDPIKWARPAFIRHDPSRDVPRDSWSWMNKLATIHTSDARGFRQWEAVGRRVKKGAKASYILAPVFVQKKDADGEKTGEGFRFYKAIPVFAIEDTEGEPLPPREEAVMRTIAAPSLYTVCAAWNIPVTVTPARDGASGSYSRRGIVLHTEDPSTFSHEVAHAAHDRLLQLRGVDMFRDMTDERANGFLEAVAELASSALIAHMGLPTAVATAESSAAYVRMWACRDSVKDSRIARALCDALECVSMIVNAANGGETRGETRGETPSEA